MVPFEEIERNEFNLNLPRYIDSQTPEDRQDIEGHLKGGVPDADIEALDRYWAVCPTLRKTLFKPNRPGYCDLAVDEVEIRPAIFGHPEFASFTRGMDDHFETWRKKAAKSLRQLAAGFHPKELIASLSEGLLAHYAGKALLDPYDVYQHLMDYWSETMQDDAYLVAVDGWKAETYRIIEKDKKGKEKDKGWACDLVPKPLIVARYFAAEQKAIDDLAAEMDGVSTELTELEEEQGGEEGAFASLEKVNKGNVTARLRELEGMYSTDDEDAEEARVLKHWLKLSAKEAAIKKKLKEAEAELDAKCYAKYPTLSEAEIQTLVIDDKWLTDIDGRVRGGLERISQGLARRVKELAERYETPMSRLAARIAELEGKVNRHLERMGFRA
jgi:type I restriction enzyme M protein